MNRSRFISMQERLVPDRRVLSRLEERLKAEEKPSKNRTPVLFAAAVCAALAVLAIPIFRAFRPASVPLHSFVIGEKLTGIVEETAFTAGFGGESDKKTEPAVDREERKSSENQAVSEASDGGEIPGGALVEEPQPITGAMVESEPEDQSAAIAAYENLMAHFQAELGQDACPDWFGGAWIQGSMLIVSVVPDGVPEEYLLDAGEEKTVGKDFFLLIQEWAGNGERTDAVGFSDGKYPLSFLRDLQDRITALPELRDMTSWGCGVDEMENRVELTVPQANEALLAALAKLDPDDDAILVQAGSAEVMEME